MADEPLARTGMTHLIEHLASHRLGVADVHRDGAAHATVTHFLMQGGANEAVEFIHSMCASLHDLPFERLQTEKSILNTEAGHHRELGWVRRLAAARYGARGYGIPGFAEIGLPALTPDDLHAWAAAYFTRGNAVLWFSGDEVPAGLDPHLPPGPRRPVPAASSGLPSTPAYISTGPEGLVGLSAVVHRGPAAMLFTELLEGELFRHLRHEGGLSYAISADYVARDAEYAEIHATADALPETQDKLISSLMSILTGLRAGGIDPGRLEAARGRLLEKRQAPDAAARRLPGLAADLLIGRRHTAEAGMLDDLRALTADDVHAAAAEALDSALLILPGQSTDAEVAGHAHVPAGSAVTAIGFLYHGFDGPGTQLVVGASAVSLHAQGTSATVEYADCAAMQAWPDGARHLWGHDGVRVAIEPNLFDAPEGFLAPLDAAIPAERVVRQPARDPREIPRRPPGTDSDRDRRGHSTRGIATRIVRVLVRIAFWTFLISTALFTVVPIDLMVDPSDGGSIGVDVSVWLFELGVGVLPTFLLGRRLHRYKKAKSTRS